VKGPWRAGRWQRIPHLPRFVATRPHPGAGELLERERRLGCWQVGPCEREREKPRVRRGGPRSAAERPDRREEKTEEARGKGEETPDRWDRPGGGREWLLAWEEKGRLGLGQGCWVGLPTFALFPFLLLFFSNSLIQTILTEFKYNLNSNLYTQHK
jgi:hypothetical protein